MGGGGKKKNPDFFCKNYSENFGAKFITIIRKPEDVLLSFYHFLTKMNICSKNETLATFADKFFFLEDSNVTYLHRSTTRFFTFQFVDLSNFEILIFRKKLFDFQSKFSFVG